MRCSAHLGSAVQQCSAVSRGDNALDMVLKTQEEDTNTWRKLNQVPTWPVTCLCTWTSAILSLVMKPILRNLEAV